MSHKQLLFHAAAREKILTGATALANAVRVTLGPKSKSVLIARKWGTPLVCNDGVTIAKEMDLADAEENLGVQVIRQAAERTGDSVGDGTTTSTILAHAIFAEGLRNVAAGASAIDLKRGIERGLRIAVDTVKRLSRPVSSRKEKIQIATISAHNDRTMGELVGDAIERVGGDGVISVEEAKGTETAVEVVQGLAFDRGYLSPYFVTDPDRMECVLSDPLILLYDKRISVMKELLPLLEEVAKSGRALLLVAEEIEGDALTTLVVNKLRGTISCAAIKAPGFGDRRKAILEDVAIVTGGQVISEERGIQLEHVTVSQLGRAARVVVKQDETTIIGGAGDKRLIAGRVEQLRRLIADAKSDYDKQKLQERLAKLVGGVAVVRVGAPSEAELKSRKEAIEDAISSTKAAVAEGIVPGAGLTLLRAADALLAEESRCEGDEKSGIRILRHALEIPTRQIADNSGVDPGVVVDRMRTGTGSFGFDAASGAYVDLVDSGIIDPTKVVRVALENAVSVASVLLLTEATMTDLPEPSAKGPAVPELG
ncbi:MAG TPA: chaperonin GroEL [Polyangiaceae bacterium]|jgi:chaperonin GroEL|nr:chaperonin GroEL [Polyangiaceae bacterium]